MAMDSPSRESSYQRGLRAEDLAIDHLTAKGLRVLDRNVRIGGGELDVVVWDGDTLCFVEVRQRSNLRFGSPEASIDAEKRARLFSAAAAYLKRFPSPPRCRMDVIAISSKAGSPVVVHHPAAFVQTT